MRPAPHPAAPPPPAPRAWLRRPDPDREDAFWEEVRRIGTPIVAPDPTHSGRRLVTFLWRAEGPLDGVYVRLNRVTDKDRVADGLMRRVPGTSAWTTTLSLPAELRCSYEICPVPAGAGGAGLVATLGGREPGLPLLPDPLVRGPVLAPAAGVRTSVLALDRAPAQPEWAGPPAAVRGRVAVDERPLLGRRRPVWSYLPDPADVGERPVGLLVLLDGEVWFGGLGVAAALELAARSGRVPPYAVVGIGNLDVRDRIAILGGRAETVREIADRVVPDLRAAHPEVAWAGPERTVLCGQSLGGATALVAALEAPEVFGAVLAHSPSLWWHPGAAPRPADLTADGPTWLREQYADAPATGTRVRIDVGQLEGLTVPQAGLLTDLMRARGWSVDLDLYTGGHDVACWRGALVAGLAALG